MADSPNNPENASLATEPGPTAARVQELPLNSGRHAPLRRGFGLRQWLRKNCSRQQLLTSFKTMLWVVPLTLLIWIYAEREQQFYPPPVTIPIEISSNDPNRLVTLRRPDEPLVLAKITGPRSGVEAVIHSWDPNGGGPVRIKLDRNLGTGDQRIDASAVIGNDPRFASHGVSVLSCQPGWLDVVIDPMVEKEIEVKAVNVPSNVASVSFSPPTVKVRGPQRILEPATADKFYLEAHLAQQPDLVPNPSTGKVALSNVKVVLPDKLRVPGVTIDGSPLVQAEATVKTEKELTLDTVPVKVVTTQAIMDGYHLVFDKNLLNVKVVGPEDKIALLADQNSEFYKSCKATFEVTQDEKGINSLEVTGSKTVPVEFKFPPGVQWKDGPKEITYTWTRRRPE